MPSYIPKVYRNPCNLKLLFWTSFVSSETIRGPLNGVRIASEQHHVVIILAPFWPILLRCKNDLVLIIKNAWVSNDFVLSKSIKILCFCCFANASAASCFTINFASTLKVNPLISIFSNTKCIFTKVLIIQKLQHLIRSSGQLTYFFGFFVWPWGTLSCPPGRPPRESNHVHAGDRWPWQPTSRSWALILAPATRLRAGSRAVR